LRLATCGPAYGEKPGLTAGILPGDADSANLRLYVAAFVEPPILTSDAIQRRGLTDPSVCFERNSLPCLVLEGLASAGHFRFLPAPTARVLTNLSC